MTEQAESVLKVEVIEIHKQLNELQSEVGDIAARQQRWQGALKVLGVVLLMAQGLIGSGVAWQLSTTSDTKEAVSTLGSTHAVASERWNNFMLQGPRFTREDYMAHIEADKAKIQDWVRSYVDEEVPPKEVSLALTALEKAQEQAQKQAESLERRVVALEKLEK